MFLLEDTLVHAEEAGATTTTSTSALYTGTTRTELRAQPLGVYTPSTAA